MYLYFQNVEPMIAHLNNEMTHLLRKMMSRCVQTRDIRDAVLPYDSKENQVDDGVESKRIHV